MEITIILLVLFINALVFFAIFKGFERTPEEQAASKRLTRATSELARCYEELAKAVEEKTQTVKGISPVSNVSKKKDTKR